MSNALRDLGRIRIAHLVRGAQDALACGDIPSAHDNAVRAWQASRRKGQHLSAADRRIVGNVYYTHGKLLTSTAHLREAVDDFARAVDCNDRSQKFRRRLRTARRAFSQSPKGLIDRENAVISFYRTMRSTRTASLADLPEAPILYYARKARYIFPPSLKLPALSDLDEFHALGTYRWQGDEKSSDQYSRWIRRLKAGNNMVAKQLGRLLVDWIWSETDVLRDTDFLVTVPGEPVREARRGFNPPDILAAAIRDYLGVPILDHVLQRNNSPRSRDLNTYREVRDCFGVGKVVSRIKRSNILLVDDVATRGYTLRACSENLRKSGADRVACITLAQSVSTHRERKAFPRQRNFTF